jgi:two-component system, cell cycle sensor histidine kinase and response regulator CckA
MESFANIRGWFLHNSGRGRFMSEELEQLRSKVGMLENKCKKLERSLVQSEERFFTVFHASNNPMAITSLREGRIIDLNEASANLGGYKREEVISNLSAEYHPLEKPEQRDAVERMLLENGRIHNYELKLRTNTGDERIVLFSADPIKVNDEPCMLTISVDITARQKETDSLRESEEKYRMLVENSLQGVAILQDSRFVFCNNTYAAMTGYSIDELLSFSTADIREMIHPDDRDIVRKRHLDRVAGEPTEPRYEYRGIKKDGTLFWVEAYASHIVYKGIPAIQLVYLDIAERKNAEKALRESEERFQLIANTIDEIFWISDAAGSTTYISPSHERIWGTPPNAFYDSPQPFFDQIHPEDRDRVAAIASQLKTGQPFEYEHRIIRPDGSIRHLWNRCYPVPDSSGRIKCYVGVKQDITARSNAEEALKESREYLHQIINSLGDPLFVKDQQHRFVMVNDALCELSGKRREELLGVAMYSVLPPELTSSLWNQEQDIFETGRQCVTEENIPDGNGKIHTVMTKKTLLTDKKGDKQIVGVLRDITEYKNLQAQFMQSQKMEAVGLLAGGVAHDFNNLLTVIKGYTEMLAVEFDPDDERREEVQQIANAAEQAVSLTRQLLAFSRKQILKPKVLNLNSILDEMGKMLRRLIGEDIEFVAIAQPGLGLIHADPVQIQQILMNIVVNARDAMPQGGKLTIETANADLDDSYIGEHPEVQKGPYVMMAISDTGIGMDKDTQARIFEPFFTSKAPGEGTGLGLSTVYGIVRQSGGYIWTYSELGKGTTFKIYLPCTEGEAPLGDKDGSLQEIKGFETVLIVEDDAFVRNYVCRILRQRGITVLDAANGKAALAVARGYAGDIHLVITDVVMPGMSGKELIVQLEAMRPGIKTLYISGYTDKAVVHHGILDSETAFLQKPFTTENLMQKIREAIQSKRD